MRFPRIQIVRTVVAALPLLFAACATMSPPQPPSLELPKPPTDLRAVRKGNKVILTWTVPTITTDRRRIRSVGPTRICREPEKQLTECRTPAGTAEPQAVVAAAAAKPSTTRSSAKSSSFSSSRSQQKVTNSFTDSLPAQMESDSPSAFVTYAIEVLNANGRGAGLSNQVQVSTIRTLAPPQDFSAHVTSQGVVLSWTTPGPGADTSAASSTQPVRYLYRVFRRLEGSRESSLVGEVPAGEHALTLTDSTFEWEETYEYRAETVTVIARPDRTELQIEGDDTPFVKVFADDVFPPAVPSGLQAVFSGPGQQAFVDLIWAPVSDVDLAGYNVYRHEMGSAAVKVNTKLVKAPAYRDSNVASGKIYLYSVSAVDVRGNESARSEEASERVP